jgi:WD40 repeat protein
LPGVVVIITDHRLFEKQTVRVRTLGPSEEALRAFWEHHGLDLGLGSSEIETALRASEGNFGLAQVLRGQMEKGLYDLSETEDRQGAFQQIWSKLEANHGLEIRNRIMGALAAALAPLPDSVFNRLLGTEAGWLDPLARKRSAPSPEGEPDSQLREEVLRELIAAQVDMKEQHRKLAEAVTFDLSPGNSTPQLREYGFRHGIRHWLEAGGPEVARRLCTDAEFLTAGCREAGPETVLRSLKDWLAQDLPRLSYREPGPIQDVHAVITEHASLLQNDPEALPSLLYDHFRNAGRSPSEIQEFLQLPSGLPRLRRKFPSTRKDPGPSRHRGSVVGCTFTKVQESTLVLSWSTDGTLNLWRADGGELVMTLARHTGEITGCVLLSGNFAVSSSRDGTLRLWGLSNAKLMRTLSGHEGAILGVTAIDTQRVVSWSEDRTLRVWDVHEERELFVLRGHEGAVTSCAVVAGDWLISGSTDATVRLWSLVEGRLIRTYRGHQAAVTGIVVLSGTHALSCSLDRAIRMWSLVDADPSSLVTLEGHSLGVLGLALSPNGRLLASWSYDRTVRVWDLSKSNLLSTLTGHTGAVLSCAFLNDGMRLVSGSADRTMRLWMTSTGEALDVFEGHERSIRCLAVESQKGDQPERIASGSDDRTLRIWDSDLCLETTSLGGASKEISLCLSSGRDSVLFGNRRGVLELRNVEEEERRERDSFDTLSFPLQGGAVDTRLEAPYRRYMVAWGWVGERVEARLRVLDLSEDPDVALLRGHEGPVLACAFTSDSHRLLSASMDHTIRVWSVNPVQFDPIGVLEGHTGPVSDIKIGWPGDQVAFSASWDGTLRLWSLGDEYPLIRVFEGHTDRVLACALRHDERLAISASADRTLRLWDLETGTTVQVLSGHSAEVTGCAFAAYGSKIISRSLDGTLRAWDVPSKRGATVFEGHSDWVNAFALDEEHGLLYSCSEDRTVRAWDLTAGEPQGVVYGVAPFRSLVATRTGVCAGDEAGNFWVLEHERAAGDKKQP